VVLLLLNFILLFLTYFAFSYCAIEKIESSKIIERVERHDKGGIGLDCSTVSLFLRAIVAMAMAGALSSGRETMSEIFWAGSGLENVEQ